MRYFSFNEYDENGGHVETLSEDDIRKEYYPYWYSRMCKRYGKEVVDEKYSFQDCIDDWCVVHWAWESKE